MTDPRHRLPTEVEEALEATGLPWELVSGSRHIHVRVDGRLVGILSRGKSSTHNRRKVRNLVAQIRRAANNT